MGCPGMGIEILYPVAFYVEEITVVKHKITVKRTIPGKIFLRCSAAHAALGFPPFRQSSKSNSGWRTGLLNDTRAESTSEMVRTPHPWTRRQTVER